MDNKSYVSSRGTVAAAADSLVHEYCIHTAIGKIGDSVVHINNAIDGADGHTVIHGSNDGTTGFTIENALDTNLFAETHGELPLEDWA